MNEGMNSFNQNSVGDKKFYENLRQSYIEEIRKREGKSVVMADSAGATAVHHRNAESIPDSGGGAPGNSLPPQVRAQAAQVTTGSWKNRDRNSNLFSLIHGDENDQAASAAFLASYAAESETKERASGAAERLPEQPKAGGQIRLHTSS